MRDELLAFYERYLAVCNRHSFSELGPFVHERLTVNGETRAASEYAEDVARVGAVFPDYR